MSDNWRVKASATGPRVHDAGNWSLGSFGILPFRKRRNPAAVASRRALGATVLVVAGMWAAGMLPGRPASASVVVHTFGAQNTTGAATLAASPTTATAAGDLLIATIRTRNTTALAPVASVVDSNAADTWTRVGTAAVQGTNADGEIWYVANAASLSTAQTVTVTVGGTSSGTSAISFTVLDVAGMATSSPLDVTATKSGNTQPANVGPTAATNQASELAVASLGWNGNGFTSSGQTTGYTVDAVHQSTASGSAAAEQAAYQVLSATGVQTYQATLSSTTAAWTGVIATFKASTGPPPTPTITSFSPTHGVAGTSVIITGAGFTGATAVKFGGTSQPTFTVNGAGAQITTTVPAAAPSGLITVTTPGGTADTSALSPSNFTVDPPPSPTITAFNPTSGSVGASVTVTGTGFTGATAVKFNGTNQPAFTVNGPGTQITTTVPTGATTGQITVTTGGGTANTSALSPPSFTVNAAATPPHIMLIVEENQSYSEIDGVSSAPYINGTLRTAYPASWVTNWYGVQHNSPYDYVELLSGVKKTSLSGGGFTDPTLVDELHTAGIPWLAYMENLSAPCKNTGSDSVNLYDVNHNPFHYYANYSSWCNTSGEGVIPYPGVSGMMSTLNGSNPPAFVWISPNDCNEMHGDTSTSSQNPCKNFSNAQLISAGDTWLKNNVGQVLSSPWFAQNGTVIITWDEAAQSDGTGCCGLAAPAGGHVATLVLSHNNNGSVVTANGDHYGTLRTIANAYGVSATNLGNAGNAANGDLSPAFGTAATPGSITGTVKDAVTGAPLSGATVSYSGGSTTTNNVGVYTLSNVSPGSYTVTASATNYVTQPATGVVVASGSATTKNFSLTPNPGSITGTVTDFVTGNPLSGATVCLGTDATCATATTTTTTNGSGVYTLSGLTEASNYQVNAVATNYTSQSATNVAVTPGGTTQKNFALVPNPGFIQGTVTDALTTLPISSATVCLGTDTTCATATTTTTTNSSGFYQFSGLTEATNYQVNVVATNYAPQTATGVAVTPGGTTTKNFALTPGPGTISGTVKDLVTTTGIVGARVCISTSGSCTGTTTTTGAGGAYTLSVAPGTYEVTSSATNYAPQSISSVVVTTGGTATKNFSLTPNPGSITGTVTDFVTGNPLSGATVCLGTDATCATATTTTTTNGSGVYTLSGLTEASNYQVNAVATNYTSQSATNVAVTPGGTTQKNFALVPNPGFIQGTVTDALTTLPISSATVCLGTDTTCATATTTTTTNSSGFYQFSGLTEATNYQVNVVATNYAPQTATGVAVTPGGTTTKNFALTPGPGTISGTVKDSVTTTGIVGARVCISTSGSCTGTTTTTGAGGAYTLSVAPGTYEVTSSATNYAPQSISSVVVTTGGTATKNFSLTPNPGSITGTVTDSALGQPIAGATVCVGSDATCATSSYTTTTNGSGAYTLSNVAEFEPQLPDEPGRHQLRVAERDRGGGDAWRYHDQELGHDPQPGLDHRYGDGLAQRPDRQRNCLYQHVWYVHHDHHHHRSRRNLHAKFGCRGPLSGDGLGHGVLAAERHRQRDTGKPRNPAELLAVICPPADLQRRF